MTMGWQVAVRYTAMVAVPQRITLMSLPQIISQPIWKLPASYFSGLKNATDEHFLLFFTCTRGSQIPFFSYKRGNPIPALRRPRGMLSLGSRVRTLPPRPPPRLSSPSTSGNIWRNCPETPAAVAARSYHTRSCLPYAPGGGGPARNHFLIIPSLSWDVFPHGTPCLSWANHAPNP